MSESTMTENEPLVTVEQVKALMPSYVVADRLTPFVETAHQIVYDNLRSTTYSADRLINIEKWLAAHCASLVIYRNPIRVENLSAKATYSSAIGQGLSSTQYGQQVLVLDSESILSNLGKKQGVFRSMNYDKDINKVY